MPKCRFSACWATRATAYGSSSELLYRPLKILHISTANAADELRPEPALSSLSSVASKPPKLAPISYIAEATPRTRAADEPNSSGCTSRSSRFMSISGKPADLMRATLSKFGSTKACMPLSTADASTRPFW